MVVVLERPDGDAHHLLIICDPQLPQELPGRAGGLQGEGGVTGHVQILAQNTHGAQLLQGLLIPQGDKGAFFDGLAHQPAVGAAQQRADAVGIDHHGLFQQLRQPDDGQVIDQRAGGGFVLQEAAAAADEQIAFLQGAAKHKGREPGDGIEPILPDGVRGRIGKNGEPHRHGELAEHAADGVQNGVIAQIAEAVIAGDGGLDDPPGIQKGVIGLQVIIGHFMHGVVRENELPPEPDERLPLPGIQGEQVQKVIEKVIPLNGVKATAAEIALLSLGQNIGC